MATATLFRARLTSPAWRVPSSRISYRTRSGPESAVPVAPPPRLVPCGPMHPQHPQPSVELQNSPDFRDAYANSVQLRVSLWDFYLLFGNIQQDSRPGHVSIRNFQGIYLSPQQAKALLNVLQQNVQQYESAFGEIRLEPKGDTNIVQ